MYRMALLSQFCLIISFWRLSLHRKQLRILPGVCRNRLDFTNCLSRDARNTLGYSSKTPKLQTIYILILDKGVFVNSFDHVFEENFGSQSVSMVDNWFTIRPIPAVNCRTETMTSVRLVTSRTTICGRLRPCDALQQPSQRYTQQGNNSFIPTPHLCLPPHCTELIPPKTPPAFTFYCVQMTAPIVKKAPGKKDLLEKVLRSIMAGRETTQHSITSIMLLLTLRREAEDLS